MEPTLHEGDLLLVLYGIGPRPGGLGLVQLPPDRSGAPRPVSVKRLRHDPDESTRWWVDSDNPREGVTSFDIGAVGADALLARVLCRLPGRHPAGRPPA